MDNGSGKKVASDGLKEQEKDKASDDNVGVIGSADEKGQFYYLFYLQHSS